MKMIQKSILLLFATCVTGSLGARTLIHDGVVQSDFIERKHWASENGRLSAGGTGKYLLCNRIIGPGDFAIVTRLSLEEINGTAASFMLGGNHIGLDGIGKTLFIEGPDLPKRSLGTNSGFVSAGKTFELVVQRAGDELRVQIDGRPVLEIPFHGGEIASFGLRPHRNTMRVRDLSFEGSLLDLPELDYVFASGEDSHKSYRIPSIIKTNEGTLLAFCEARVDGPGDAGDINLVMKRSLDHGRTWSPLTILRDIERTAGNPCPVVEAATGRIVLVFCEMDYWEHHIMEGKSKRRVFSIYSDDDGVTWSEPVNITDVVNPGGQYDWLASGPGVGIQLQKGPNKGRMIIPFANSVGHNYGVHTIYSDDRGQTWTPTDRIPGGCNESQLVELSDGRLMLNMRMQQNSKGYRGLSFSEDSGETWSPVVHDDELSDPTCQASIISHQNARGRYLIFSNPATGGRQGMTVRLSADDGATWPVKKLLYPRSSAYSNLVMTDDKHVLCLFEGGPAQYHASGIALIRLPFEELELEILRTNP